MRPAGSSAGMQSEVRCRVTTHPGGPVTAPTAIAACAEEVVIVPRDVGSGSFHLKRCTEFPRTPPR